ncbi:glycosyl transferase [Orrella marina]|uniref:Glycosyl transferase n=2 Tax=Orrella marina TaxID=2163011 RepID=A0A2R4XMG9_9BURK|nr:glycosyl transferase [Orrella marina]
MLMKISQRVCIFLPSLEGGGAERVMATLANEFARRGFTVDLVLAKAKGPYLSSISDQVNIVNLDCDRVFSALLPLSRYLKSKKPSAVLSAMTHTNVIAILARMMSGVHTRLVISERSTISMEAGKATGLASKVIYTLAPRLYRRADKIVCVSQAVASDLLEFARLPQTLVQTIYNPFDLQRIRALSQQPVEHPWFAPGEPPVILGIGRLTEQKDFGLLIKAFTHVRKKYPSRLVILGDGSDREHLLKLANSLGLSQNDFDMPGFTDNPFAYLARSKVFVLSSRWEGLPGALIEAMACGTPVISTDCPSGPNEILQSGHWGTIIPVGDTQALIMALTEQLDPDTVRKLPDVRVRAEDFALEQSATSYLGSLALPVYPQEGRASD